MLPALFRRLTVPFLLGATTALAQPVVLLDETFESTTGSDLPANWSTKFAPVTTYATAATPFASGGAGNTSSRVLTLTDAFIYDTGGAASISGVAYSPTLDLSACYTGTDWEAVLKSGVTLTLAFKLAADTGFNRLTVSFANPTDFYKNYATSALWSPTITPETFDLASGAGAWQTFTFATTVGSEIVNNGFDPAAFRLAFGFTNGTNPTFGDTATVIYLDDIRFTATVAAVPELTTSVAWLATATLAGAILLRSRRT